MAGNTTFFIKAAEQKITWKDIFSDVFKKHSREDGERLFVAGTALSTPHEGQMLSQWRKPWLFARVGLFGLAFLLIMLVLVQSGGEVFAYIPLMFVGAVLVPFTILLLLWEMNIPRNIPIYQILIMFLAGGGLSLIFTLIMGNFVGSVQTYWAPLTEEPAKLFALCIFLRNPKYRYTLNGLLIGAAVGAGFAAMETMGYAVAYGFGNLLLRGILAPGGHVVYAALYGGALAMVKGTEKLQSKHFMDQRFLVYFGIAFALHFIWNTPIGLVSIPIFGDLKFVLLIVAAWVALLRILKQGIMQIMRISQPLGVSAAAAPALVPENITLRAVSGYYSGGVFPLSGNRLVFGRDSKQANIVFPSSTPGISSIHCDITIESGTVMLTDRNSSYGTFFVDGTRLTPGKPYPLPPRQGFYLANRENLFEIE